MYVELERNHKVAMPDLMNRDSDLGREQARKPFYGVLLAILIWGGVVPHLYRFRMHLDRWLHEEPRLGVADSSDTLGYYRIVLPIIFANVLTIGVGSMLSIAIRRRALLAASAQKSFVRTSLLLGVPLILYLMWESLVIFTFLGVEL